MYLDAFYDAGNLWSGPRDFDPTTVVPRRRPVGRLYDHAARFRWVIDEGYGFDP
jgi:hypothetical protein